MTYTYTLPPDTLSARKRQLILGPDENDGRARPGRLAGGAAGWVRSEPELRPGGRRERGNARLAEAGGEAAVREHAGPPREVVCDPDGDERTDGEARRDRRPQAELEERLPMLGAEVGAIARIERQPDLLAR